jgi:hypothetical protein
MRTQLSPLREGIFKVIPRTEFLDALVSALAIAALIGLALPILSLLFTP